MEREIEIRKGKAISRKALFLKKAKYHKKLSRLSFKEKISILMKLWKIAEAKRRF